MNIGLSNVSMTETQKVVKVILFIQYSGFKLDRLEGSHSENIKATDIN
jgi:hypothetical protein